MSVTPARPRAWRRPWSAALAVAALALTALWQAPAAEAATFSLQVSQSPTRSSPRPLAGTAVSGKVYIFVAPNSGMRRVDFYLDDRARSGSPTHTESTLPMDFLGGPPDDPTPWNSDDVADGMHTLTAVVTPTSGSAVVLDVTFTVGRRGLSVSSPDDALLRLGEHRLVFSTVRSAATATKYLTFTNTGTRAVTVSHLAISGGQASSYRLTTGSSLSVPAGGRASVGVRFTPTAATGCPSSSNPDPIGDVERYATLSWTSTDDGAPNGYVKLGGLNSCQVEGYNEPVLAQMFRALGFTTKVSTKDTRQLGSTRTPTSADEVYVPRFRQASSSAPVTLVPLAHYSGRTIVSGGYGATGWYGPDDVPTPCSSSAGCHELYRFASDTSTAYTDNQQLLPLPGAASAFDPSGSFGVFNGDGRNITFSDDGRNKALTPSGSVVDPVKYLHCLRIYRAYGPGRTALPHTWLIGVDITRVPSYKNNDFQDVVLLLRNADPA